MLPVQPNTAARVLTAAPDWLTVTSKVDPGRAKLATSAHSLFASQRDAGNAQSPFGMLGYSGVSTRGIAFAWKDESLLVRLSGEMAAMHWREFLGAASNCSRIDLAVTARLSQPDLNLGELVYADAVRSAAERGKELHVSAVRSNRGGTTVYLGSRKSELFARLYDKYAESGDEKYRGCWRWELEIKGKRAVCTAWDILKTDDATKPIRATVHRYFSERGARPWWNAEGDPLWTVPPAATTDDERKLAWLADQVRPSVSELLTRRQRADVLIALGLAWRDDDGILRLTDGLE